MWNSTATETVITNEDKHENFVPAWRSHLINPEHPDLVVTIEVKFEKERTEPKRNTIYGYAEIGVKRNGEEVDFYQDVELGPLGNDYAQAWKELERLYVEREVELSVLEEWLHAQANIDTGEILDALCAEVGDDIVRPLLESALENGSLTPAQLSKLGASQVNSFYRSTIAVAQRQFTGMVLDFARHA